MSEGRAALERQAARLEELVGELEASLDEADVPATRRRLETTRAKLAELTAALQALDAEASQARAQRLDLSLDQPHAAQLEALLELWRSHRHPRLADLIDCVSAELTASLPPVAWAELPARWARREPTEVGRLLSLPWPRAREEVTPVLRAILELPDDPRVAAAIARQLVLARYDFSGLEWFYEPLSARLAALGDVRQLAVLRSVGSRPRLELLRRLDSTVMASLRLEPRPLPPEVEAAVAVLDGRWAAWVERRAAAAARTRELFAAVFDAPADLARRAVLADWLVEQGELRGEFISLQLAPPGEASRERQRALLDACWDEWVGALRAALAVEPRFEAGFPVAGRLARDVTAEVFEHREWRTFVELGVVPGLAVAAATHPNLAGLRALKDVLDAELGAVLATGAPLTSLSVYGRALDFDSGALRSLKQLEALDLQEPLLFELEPRLRRSGVRLRRLRVTLFETGTPAGLERVQRAVGVLAALPIDEAEVCCHAAATVRLERGEDGAFSTLVCLAGPEHLLDLLPALPASVKTVRTAVPPALVTRRRWARLLRRFPSLRAESAPLVVRPDRRTFELRLEGALSLLRTTLRDVARRDFAMHLDSFKAFGRAVDPEAFTWDAASEDGEPTGFFFEEGLVVRAVLPVIAPDAAARVVKELAVLSSARQVSLRCGARELVFQRGAPPTTLAEFFVGLA